MEEDDSVDILHQIAELKILDWDPLGSRILEHYGNETGSSYEDVSNKNNTAATSSPEIDNRQNVNLEIDEVERHKPKRGRPKKRVFQRRSETNMDLQSDRLAQNVRNKNQDLIRTTTSPIPDNFKVKPYFINGGLETIICEYQEQGETLSLQDQEGDETDIMQEILSSGILEWNPQVPWVARHIAHDGLNGDQEIIEKSRELSLKGITQENGNSKGYHPRRPRGRPARKPKTQRKKGSKIMPSEKISSVQDLQKGTSRYLIRATSNPVHESKKARKYHANCWSGIEERAFRQHVPPNKRHRGRPKKRVRHARVTESTHKMIQESSFISLELEDQQNEYLQSIRSWSPAPSAGRVVDDDYRPSPSILATVRSPYVEVQTNAIPDLTVEDIASRAMAKPLFWTSVWNNWSTLGLDQWLDATVANFYLAHVWYEVHDTSRMRYVDLYTARVANITAEEKEVFKRDYFIPHEGRCPMVPVAFIVHHSDHFFVVIFDYQRRRAHILGRH
ncbi:hypothetical protein BDR06DRAFT_978179, partial [Suillus hirtellus]